jgi:hypothetical protein
MNQDALRHDLFLLLGYLLTSARGLYEEPTGYGPFRLLDTAGRLLAVMQAHNLADPFLDQLEDVIQAERFGNSDDQELRDVLDELCMRYAAELKNRSQEDNP